MIDHMHTRPFRIHVGLPSDRRSIYSPLQVTLFDDRDAACIRECYRTMRRQGLPAWSARHIIYRMVNAMRGSSL